MFGTLTVREAKGDAGHLILDANHRVIALCSHHADAVDLAAAWNKRNDADALLARLNELSEADEARRYQRTPQQEQELEVMRSRGEL